MVEKTLEIEDIKVKLFFSDGTNTIKEYYGNIRTDYFNRTEETCPYYAVDAEDRLKHFMKTGQVLDNINFGQVVRYLVLSRPKRKVKYRRKEKKVLFFFTEYSWEKA